MEFPCFCPFLVKRRKYAYHHLLEAVKELKQVAKHPPIRLLFNDLSPSERKLILEVREKTIEKNVNNLTRTKAYLDFYLEHPDIHWALLAPMVSRIAGWNMTDLKGEWLPQKILL